MNCIIHPSCSRYDLPLQPEAMRNENSIRISCKAGQRRKSTEPLFGGTHSFFDKRDGRYPFRMKYRVNIMLYVSSDKMESESYRSTARTDNPF